MIRLTSIVSIIYSSNLLDDTEIPCIYCSITTNGIKIWRISRRGSVQIRTGISYTS